MSLKETAQPSEIAIPSISTDSALPKELETTIQEFQSIDR